MEIRTHVGRDMDFSLWSNRAIAVLGGLALVVAGALWLTGTDAGVLWAPLHVFVFWALVREIDPDHDYTAIVAGVVAGGWVLAGQPAVSLFPIAGMLLATRIVTNTTGRRPLLADLVVLAALATGISFTDVGWVAGFGLAVAIYVDDRMSGEPTRAGVITAAAAAVGSAVLASLTNAFPRELPDVMPAVVVVTGFLALLAVVREPELPLSVSDSRMKTPITQPRLHASRVLFGAVLFGVAILAGSNGISVVPLIVAFALALASNEVERIVRTR